MRRITAFDSLLAQVWKQAISSLRNKLREESLPTLSSVWVVSILLKVGLSPKEPEIRDYITLLNDWVEQLEVKATILDESSTGLLGLWIYLHGQQRKHVGNHFENLFLRSVEHNLEKSKDLSLSTNVDLLGAVAAGLRSISSHAELQTRISKHLKSLVKNADALVLIQLLQSWELIQKTDDIPSMDIQHRLKAIAVDEDRSIIERAMAYYGQYHLGTICRTPNIEHEMRFLDYLSVAGYSNQDESRSIVQAYILSLPYLKEKMSYKFLFDAWQRYTESIFKRAKTENYWARYLFIVFLAIFVFVSYWPRFRQFDFGFQMSIGTAVATALLILTTFTIEVTAELYGRQFWKKGRVEIFILLLGAVISIIALLVEGFLK